MEPNSKSKRKKHPEQFKLEAVRVLETRGERSTARCPSLQKPGPDEGSALRDHRHLPRALKNERWSAVVRFE